MNFNFYIPDDADWGISAKGFRPKTAGQYFIELEHEAKQLFGQDTRLNKGNTLGHLLDLTSNVGSDINVMLMAVMSQQYLDWVTGNALDWFGDSKGLVRKQAVSAFSNHLKVQGTDGYVLLEDTIFVATNGNKYRVVKQITLDGTVQDVEIESLKKGRGSGANAHTINRLEKSTPDVTSIDNLDDIFPGADIESDDIFRDRIRSYLNVTTGSTVDAIKSALLKNPTVEYANVFENNENATKTINGHSLLAGQIISIVFGSDLDSAAKTQFDTRSAGISTAGNHLTTIESSSRQQVKERIQGGQTVSIYINISVKPGQNQPFLSQETERDIRESIQQYFYKRIEPGMKLDYEKIRGKVEGHDDIIADDIIVEISKDNASFVKTDLTFQPHEMAVVEDKNIVFI